VNKGIIPIKGKTALILEHGAREDQPMITKKPMSPSEEKMLNLLREQKEPIPTTDLVDLFYKGEEKPEHAQKVVSGILRNLEYKTRKQAEKVKRSRRMGPHPITVWIEKKGAKK